MKLEFTYDRNNCDETKPLIYAWFLQNHIYVGKSDDGASRPLKHYKRNVERYFRGEPYRPGNPNGWRKVHLAMIEAVKDGEEIRLKLVENVGDGEDIYQAEEHWRVALNADLNG